MAGSIAECDAAFDHIAGAVIRQPAGWCGSSRDRFSWPGLGYLAVQSIIYRDFQLVQGIVLWIALMYMVINLVVDISYNRLDPRLRKEGR